MSVLRLDRGSLRSPARAADGRLRVDGHLTRTGVFTYRNPDGTERRELRPPDEVFRVDSLASFQLIPVTDDHPPANLTSADMRRHAVGAVGEGVRRDGDMVAAPMVIFDAATISKVEAGKRQLSCGYECDLDETPGEWQGERYDAVQRNIRGNHVAIVESGRAGPAAAIRMDAAVRVDAEWDTAYVNDLPDSAFLYVEPGDKDGDGKTVPRSKRHFPYRDSSGAVDLPHLRNALARIPQSDVPASAKAAATARGQRLLRGENKGDAMDEQKMAEALAASEARAAKAEADLVAASARADKAEGELAAVRARLDAEDARRAAEPSTDQLRADAAAATERAIAAETRLKVAEDPARFAAAVQARVDVEGAALAVLGEDAPVKTSPTRDLMVAVVEKLQGVTVGLDRSDDYLKARFDAAMEGFRGGRDALARLRKATRAEDAEVRHDTAEGARAAMIARNKQLGVQPLGKKE